MGGGWDPAPSPRPALPACEGLILSPETVLRAVVLAPLLVFHPLFIPFPLSGLSGPGNDSLVSFTSQGTGVFPSSPWLLA